ncbi:DUF1045 domain-containing protein [Agrobacterium sp. NPDC090273]|uniref:DUF1045 domain-containing protein n=1 Tax=Agrobacterium sp. NPDC090273 TaxID=3363919 RepID=UPI00383A1DD8
MRYAIHFTPSPNDPLTQAAAAWLGRDVYSGRAVEPPGMIDLAMPDISYHTALPRRYGFHGTIKAPFRLAEGHSEASLLRDLMRFSGKQEPFVLPQLVVAKLENVFSLVPERPCDVLHFLAASVVQEFDRYRAPIGDAEIERANPERLSAAQLTNLYRWGSPHVMDEFRFQMTLTGSVEPVNYSRIERAVKTVFEPLLARPMPFANLALFIEDEPGAPFRVHSLHPMGRVSARRIA